MLVTSTLLAYQLIIVFNHSPPPILLQLRYSSDWFVIKLQSNTKKTLSTSDLLIK